MAIVIDNSSTGTVGGGLPNSMTFNITIGSGPNRYLLIGTYAVGGIGATTVTIDGTPAVSLGSYLVSGSSSNKMALFGLANPASGSRSIVLARNPSGADRFSAIAVSLFGVDQNNPLGTFASAGNTGTAASVSIPSTASDTVLAFLARQSTDNITHGSGQTQIGEVFANTSNSQRLTVTQKAGSASSTLMTHTIGQSTAWGMVGIALKEATTITPKGLVSAYSVVASGSGATGWSARSLFKINSSFYAVTQDSIWSPKQRVYASTNDGATWAEQDSSNAPDIVSGSYPHSTSLREGSSSLVAGRFTGTSTLRAREFNTTTNTWDGTDLQGANATTDANSLSPIRVSANSTHTILHYTSNADTADLARTRRTSGAWAAANDLSVTSDERSIYADVVDDAGFHQRFQYDTENDDFSVRSITNNGTTNGTLADIDATATTTEAGHAPSTFEPYLVSSTTRVTAAYIDANDTINERTASLDVTSSSITFGTQRQVTNSAAYAGGKLSTCIYDGRRYTFASRADGTSIDYWISNNHTTSNTWGSINNVVSGTDLHLAQALPVEGTGILLLYQSGTDVIADWAVDGPSDPGSGTAEFFYAQII